MCGLHGIMTKTREINADEFIRSAFTANMLRGTDSSGVASIETASNLYDSHKLPVSGNYFVQDGVAQRIINRAGAAGQITMCHVRAATVGSVSLANAHPFVVEQQGATPEDGRVVIGMHNGTLQRWQSHKNAKYYTVDSEWAINHIAEEGFDAFEDIYGAFCFVWWDSDKPGTLNIARNKERSLYVVMLANGGMAYASEAGMLHWLLERHRVEVDGDILELEADYWYRFDMANPKEFTKVKLPTTAAITSSSYTTTPSSTDTTRRTTSTAASVVSKVADVIRRAKESTTNLPTPINNVTSLPTRNRNVSMVEYKAARDMGVLGKTAEFTPYMEWADGIEGTAIVGGCPVTATVRGYDTRFTEDETWDCPIIGVQDDGEEIVFVLGPPVKVANMETIH